MEAEIARLLNVTTPDKLKLQELMQEYLQLNETASDVESDGDDNADERGSETADDADFDMVPSVCDTVLAGINVYPEAMSGDAEQEFDKASTFR